MPRLLREIRYAAAAIVVVGDSLAACCPFGKLSRRPFAVLNLAKGGAKLADIAAQMKEARKTGARCVIIDGGLNDLMHGGASVAEIERDFRCLLSQLDGSKRAIFTLMPHVADRALTPRIDAANRVMAGLCREPGILTLDLNPLLSSGGARLPEMTNDGLHFSPRANAAWLAALGEIMA
jgi:lysophospholipase L1-like esterase